MKKVGHMKCYFIKVIDFNPLCFKVCQDPASTLDTCIEEEKMVFQFQACPDVPGSERAGKCYWFLSILSVADL